MVTTAGVSPIRRWGRRNVDLGPIEHCAGEAAAPLVERYHHAMMMKGRAETRRRSAVQHIDSYEAWYEVEHWKHEVQEALAAVRALR